MQIELNELLAEEAEIARFNDALGDFLKNFPKRCDSKKCALLEELENKVNSILGAYK